MHVADCSSQNRCQACAHGVDRAAWSGCKPASRNPRAAIRELWASRKPQLADCSSQHRGQACAEARLQLAEHRSQLADRGAGSPFLRSQRAPRSSQGADFCAGGPRLTLFSSRRIADRTVADRSTLVRRSRLTLFSSRRIADRKSQIAALWPGGQGRGQLWFALSQFAGRKVQEFEQEGPSSQRARPRGGHATLEAWEPKLVGRNPTHPSH